MVEKVTVKKAFSLNNTIFLDARTPKEFDHDHIIGAINVPILSNEERHEIGIIYKQKSREEAIEKGIEFLPAKIPSIFGSVKNYKDKNIIVYCARGGMRSKIIASLLESVGFKVLQMEGGYKSFRHYILNELNNFQIKPKIICLYGLTCSGKTDLLNQFENSLDLEGLAQHRGSLYGSVGLDSRSQKKFENLLLQRLKELNKFNSIYVEGESRRIGNVEIPPFLFKAMKSGENILITRSISRRVEECVKEYFTSKNIDKIKEITPTLKDVISNKKKEEVVSLIDSGKYSEAAKILLEDYYDLLYAHTLKSVEFSSEINNDHLEKAKEKIKKN